MRGPTRLLGGGGVDLFHAVCEQDLEGTVAKRADGIYDPNATTWIKVKNSDYSQAPSGHTPTMPGTRTRAWSGRVAAGRR